MTSSAESAAADGKEIPALPVPVVAEDRLLR